MEIRTEIHYDNMMVSLFSCCLKIPVTFQQEYLEKMNFESYKSSNGIYQNNGFLVKYHSQNFKVDPISILHSLSPSDIEIPLVLP